MPRNLLEVARALLQHGADPNARLQSAPAQLFGPNRGAGSEVPPEAADAAAVNATGTFVQQPAREANVSATPFFLAAKFVNTPMMTILVEGGAHPEMTINDGTTPLMVAAGLTQVQGPSVRRGQVSPFTTWNDTDSLEAVTHLLGLGMDPNTANDAGQTALQGAAYMGANDVVELLAAAGAHLDAQDAEGQTAFRIAEAHLNVASQGISQWPETAALLSRLGADTTRGVDGRVLLRDLVRRAGDRVREDDR